MTLTRNESADLVQKAWATMVENSPEDTDYIREHGVESYLLEANPERFFGADTDHYEWLFAMLSDEETLRLADKFAATARKAADRTRPTIVNDNGDTVPVFWRD